MLKNSCHIVFLLVAFATNLIVAQGKINHVQYSVFLNESIENNETRYQSLISNVKQKLLETSFSLDSSDSLVVFNRTPNSLSDEDNAVILDICFMFGSQHFKKKGDEIIYSSNEKFQKVRDKLTAMKIQTDWVISDEIKFINNIKCFKATAKLSRINDDGSKQETHDLTAWFAPEINFFSGPKCLDGLPGLILELKTPLVIFSATDLRFLNDQNVVFPNKEIISEDEMYDSIYQN